MHLNKDLLGSCGIVGLEGWPYTEGGKRLEEFYDYNLYLHSTSNYDGGVDIGEYGTFEEAIEDNPDVGYCFMCSLTSEQLDTKSVSWLKDNGFMYVTSFYNFNSYNNNNIFIKFSNGYNGGNDKPEILKDIPNLDSSKLIS